MKQLRTVASILALMGVAVCAWAGPPYNVDDPGTTEHKHFNLEVSYSSSQVKGSEEQAFPSLSLAYGLYNNVEVGVGFSGISVRNAGAGRLGGFGDISFGGKWRFLEETKSRPQLALGYGLKIPTASVRRGLGSGRTDHSLWISGAKSFGRAMLFTNVGYNFQGASDEKNNLFYGVGLEYQVTEQLLLGAQFYGNTSGAPGERGELAWGGGLTYNFAPNRSFLLQLGRSERGFSDLNVFAGFSFTFGN
jgi:hypothetical protein